MWFGDFIRFLVNFFWSLGDVFFFVLTLSFSTFSNNGPRKSSAGFLLPGYSRSSATSPWSQRYPASTIHSPSVSRLRTAPLKSDRNWKSTIRDLSPIDVRNWNSNLFIFVDFSGVPCGISGIAMQLGNRQVIADSDAPPPPPAPWIWTDLANAVAVNWWKHGRDHPLCKSWKIQIYWSNHYSGHFFNPLWSWWCAKWMSRCHHCHQ